MTQTLEELQVEIEQSRAKLDLTLERLEEKLTVSGVVDDVLGTARNGRLSPAFDRVLDALRSNPVPVLLVAAGAALLLHRLRPKPNPASPARSPRVAVDEDLPQAPLEPRLYHAGATTLQSREDLEGHRRATNVRI
jgi:hypothetical protein